ncbi:hypothetical protein FRC01_007577 [Tulasnella sp. 417]|nr:hypothetical protein FRC01_007577 [Tulasnella sp. 417]
MEASIAFQLPSTPQSPRQPAHVPMEILEVVLLLSLPTMDVAQAPPKTALALVCRFWNAIIESSPMFWKSPIDVYGFCSNKGTLVDEELFYRFLRKVQPHAERWRHVTLKVVEGGKPYTLGGVLPSLESIKLRSKNEASVPIGYRSLTGSPRERPPRLRKIFLRNVSLGSWSISFPPSLEKLDLKNVRIYASSSFQLLSLPAGSPNLVSLRLLRVHSTRERNVTTAPIAELPTLRKLVLDDVSEVLIRHLLEHLRLPDDCTTTVTCRVSGSNPTASFLTPALSRYQETFRSAAETEGIAIGVFNSALRVMAESKKCRICLNLDHAHAIRDALKWFGVGAEGDSAGSHLEALPVDLAVRDNTRITLKFASTCTDSGFNHLRSILNLECITKIKTKLVNPGVQTKLLSYFSEFHRPIQQMTTTANPETAGAQVAGAYEVDVLPFPGLRELVMNGAGDNVLKDFVKSRSDRARNTSTFKTSRICGNKRRGLSHRTEWLAAPTGGNIWGPARRFIGRDGRWG